MAKSTKSTKSTTEKETAAPKAVKETAPKKTAAPKKEATPKKEAAPKKAASAKANPADKLEKACKEAVAKLQSLDNGKYQEVREKLEWCIGSYSYDKNPEGLVNYGRQASDLLKSAREENSKAVPKKVVDDLDKALAGF